jgi:hypothetical protein
VSGTGGELRTANQKKHIAARRMEPKECGNPVLVKTTERGADAADLKAQEQLSARLEATIVGGKNSLKKVAQRNWSS